MAVNRRARGPSHTQLCTGRPCNAFGASDVWGGGARDRVLMTHDGSPANSDLFEAVLTMLDPQVALTLAHTQPPAFPEAMPVSNINGALYQDQERAKQLGRELEIRTLHADPGQLGDRLVKLAQEGKYDLIILTMPSDMSIDRPADGFISYVLRHAPCRVFLAAPPVIPQEPEQ